MRKNNGVTLVALIITIIILLILAGVVIAMTVGDEGIIKKAQMAVDEYNEAIVQEQKEVENLTNLLNDIMKDENNKNEIPIKTAEQLAKIGTGEEVEIDGVTYAFTKEKMYILQNDIEYTENYDLVVEQISNNKITIKGKPYKVTVTTSGGKKEYYTEDSKYYIATNQYGYVVRGLQLYYDGIDNSGTGTHNSTATQWKDLSGNNYNGTLKNMDSQNCWEDTGLKFDGIDDWVLIAKMNYENITLETVNAFSQINNGKEQLIISNVERGGYGIGLFKNGLLGFSVYVSELSSYRVVFCGEPVSERKYSISGSYDGYIVKERKNDDYKESEVNGTIKTTEKDTYMVLGGNPNGQKIAHVEGNVYFSGMLYCVRVYNRALSDEEKEINYKVDKQRYEV